MRRLIKEEERIKSIYIHIPVSLSEQLSEYLLNWLKSIWTCDSICFPFVLHTTFNLHGNTIRTLSRLA